MRIALVSPASSNSRSGNHTTAVRWLKILRNLGHHADLANRWDGGVYDMLVALHAWKSRESIHRFHRTNPSRPLLVALTGTDVYRDIRRRSLIARSLQVADRLIVLQPLSKDALPEKFHSKVRTIFQSVSGAQRATPSKRSFDVCVLAHLRSLKDPFRAAMASRLLPSDSKIRILQIGGAHTEDMQNRAEREAARNPRLRWLGNLPRGRALARLGR